MYLSIAGILAQQNTNTASFVFSLYCFFTKTVRTAGIVTKIPRLYNFNTIHLQVNTKITSQSKYRRNALDRIVEERM